MSLDILLATYNGSKYLKEQLDSILNQTYPHFTLWIRDDGSTDETYQILSDYAKKDLRIKILNSSEKLGPRGNFGALMEVSSNPYIAFADQDDVWHQDKLSILMQFAKDKDKGLPLLIHHDLEVVDDKLDLIHTSFWAFSHLDPHAKKIGNLLLQNNVTGCAMLVNRPLLELALPVPTSAIMHDWWLALTASAFGEIYPLNQALVKYRQHSKNQIGAKSYSRTSYLKKGFQKLFGMSYEPLHKQAKAFLENYQEDLDHDKTALLQDFCSLPESSFLKSRKLIWKRGFWKQGKLRNLTFFLTPYKL